MLTEKERHITEQFKRHLHDYGVECFDLIVFGSRARGDADKDSDLDLLVIVENLNKKIREVIRHCAWEIGFENDIIIQAIIMTREETENSPQRSSLLMTAVNREGIRV